MSSPREVLSEKIRKEHFDFLMSSGVAAKPAEDQSVRLAWAIRNTRLSRGGDAVTLDQIERDIAALHDAGEVKILIYLKASAGPRAHFFTSRHDKDREFLPRAARGMRPRSGEQMQHTRTTLRSAGRDERIQPKTEYRSYGAEEAHKRAESLETLVRLGDGDPRFSDDEVSALPPRLEGKASRRDELAYEDWAQRMSIPKGIHTEDAGDYESAPGPRSYNPAAVASRSILKKSPEEEKSRGSSPSPSSSSTPAGSSDDHKSPTRPGTR